MSKLRIVDCGLQIMCSFAKVVYRVPGVHHDSPSERGCVEDQPQRVAMFGAAAAGTPLPRTQPRSV